MKRSSKTAAEVIRMFEADPTISIRTIARKISDGDDEAAWFFVWRLLKSRKIQIRGRSRAKVERNTEIRKRVESGERQADVARQIGVSKVRVHQIVRGRDR